MTTPLAIVGRGKMGRLVEQLAPEFGFDVRARFSSSNIATLSRESLLGATVAIEFSTPAAAPSNIQKLSALGVNIVSGTTLVRATSAGSLKRRPGRNRASLRRQFLDRHESLLRNCFSCRRSFC